MRRARRSATIHDVAKAAGVSVSTVSRVLNEKDDVAPETFQKVRAVIDDMGYTSSLAARGMRSHRTRVIGLIIPDVSSPYCTEVLRGINQAAARSEYDLIIYTPNDARKYLATDQERKYVNLLNGGIADGVIVVTPVATSFPCDAPVVVIDPNKESPDYPGIIATNREGVLEAMSYLIGLGHRRIGFITGRLDLVSACQRLQGYRDALAEAGIPIDDSLIQIGNYETDVAENCARALLALENPPTAIFASNDMSAYGVYQVARQLGVSIPGDLSVIGFDNLRESAFLTPTLTTIDQSIPKMGSQAVEMLIKLLKGESMDCELCIYPTRLIVRESCAAISG